VGHRLHKAAVLPARFSLSVAGPAHRLDVREAPIPQAAEQLAYTV